SPAGVVEVQCHVLPHKDRLEADVHDFASGPDGWTAQQGFYVYRNERLLLAGSWLGLGQGRAWTKEEAHRLARVRVDIPNTADSAEGRETPRTGFAGDPPAEISAVLDVMYRNLVTRKGMSPQMARARLRNTEPFNNHLQLVDALPDLPQEA